mgnify:CR=1 FL=1
MIEFVQMKRSFATKAQRTRRFHKEVIEDDQLNVFKINLICQLEVKLLGKHKEVLCPFPMSYIKSYVLCHMSCVPFGR